MCTTFCIKLRKVAVQAINDIDTEEKRMWQLDGFKHGVTEHLVIKISEPELPLLLALVHCVPNSNQIQYCVNEMYSYIIHDNFKLLCDRSSISTLMATQNTQAVSF
jgi:hypothetical protein